MQDGPREAALDAEDLADQIKARDLSVKVAANVIEAHGRSVKTLNRKLKREDRDRYRQAAGSLVPFKRTDDTATLLHHLVFETEEPTVGAEKETGRKKS
jgi:hypothetical protein